MSHTILDLHVFHTIFDLHIFHTILSLSGGTEKGVPGPAIALMSLCLATEQ